MQCVFCGIVSGEIPKSFVYEDDDYVAFDDIQPKAPVHVLLVPKKHISGLVEATGFDQGIVGKLVKQLGIADSYKIVVNGGRLQEVPHLHYHILKGE